ncbi:MAG: hypothetical protein H8K05_17150 [Nitrospira sp.]|nr:hypothetical protein [Nitrospira sp.]
MQKRMRRGIGGVVCAALAIAAVFGVSCARPASAEEGTGNMVFFRGGFMNLNQDRSGQIFTDTNGIAGVNGGNAGWYAGAGLDLVMSKDVWGGMDKTWVVGEIGVQFNSINSSRVNNVAGSIATRTLSDTLATDPQ